MKKVIKVKVGEPIPEGAVFLFQKEEQEYRYTDRSYGVFFDTAKAVYEKVTYIYFELNI